MKKIAITIQKGGAGKTATALALSAILADEGKKVLLVDLDTQATATNVLDIQDIKESTIDLLAHNCSAKDVVYEEDQIPFDIIPNDSSRKAEEIKETLEVSNRLKDGLVDIDKYYDYCIIDTPPALNQLTINALTAADYVIVPTQADGAHLLGINNLFNVISEVQKYTNPELKVAGILITRFRRNTTLHKSIVSQLEEFSVFRDTKVFNTRIREAIAVSEAYSKSKLLSNYAPKSPVFKDYLNFSSELLETIKGE